MTVISFVAAQDARLQVTVPLNVSAKTGGPVTKQNAASSSPASYPLTNASTLLSGLKNLAVVLLDLVKNSWSLKNEQRHRCCCWYVVMMLDA